MSRNQREGRYAGCKCGIHMRASWYSLTYQGLKPLKEIK